MLFWVAVFNVPVIPVPETVKPVSVPTDVKLLLIIPVPSVVAVKTILFAIWYSPVVVLILLKTSKLEDILDVVLVVLLVR